ncbi:MAG: protein translocase subunit SecD, partial [Oscillospiraceae bacterium]|nr:protein translocase subunit SecD [Oscillospiraceae bacterium]
MKKTGKAWFFIVAILIFALAYTSFFGVSTYYGDIENKIVKGADDIRFGIDIRGGVDVTFMPADGAEATHEQMAAAESVIKLRLVNLNITDYEVYTDYNKNRIIVRFPWKEDEASFNPEAAIEEIGATALLTFREGYERDSAGAPSGTTAEAIILEGQDVVSATGARQQTSSTSGVEYVVQLKLSNDGKAKFAEATGRLAGNGYISIWMDNTMISAPFVQVQITDGEAIITGSDSLEEAQALADKINAGALPFALSAESYSTISPTLGSRSLEVMVMAGIIAFILVAAYMILMYRLPGFIACIALLGQTAATIAF